MRPSRTALGIVAFVAAGGCLDFDPSSRPEGDSDNDSDNDVPGGDWHRQGWRKRRLVDVGPTGQPAVADFPLLVRLADDVAASGPTGVSFVASDGATLAHEVDHWDASAAAVWVKVPLLASATSFWVYFDPAAGQVSSSSSLVWAGHAGVWHLENIADGAPDSSPAAHASDLQGAPVSVAGAVGQAMSLAGLGCAVVPNAPPDPLDVGGQRITVEAWVRRQFTADGDRAVVARFSEVAGESAYYLGASLGTNGNPLFDVFFCAEDGVSCAVTRALPHDQWTYLAAVRDGVDIFLYVNGVGPVENDLPALLPIPPTPLPTGLGCQVVSGAGEREDHWIGAIDEVRIAATARPSAWFALHYANVSGTLPMTFGEVEQR